MGASSGERRVPRELGFRMPAEWEPHQATWLAWPHNRQDWPGKFQPIQWVYAEIVRHLARVERVCIIVKDERQESSARRVLSRSAANLDKVDFYRWPTDRVWARDSGPIFLKNDDTNETAITNWRFNGWAKYPNWKNDDQIPARVAEVLSKRSWRPTVSLAGGKQHRVVLEGGSIDVNGRGTLLTTEECLLSPIQARNPGVGREQLEACFFGFLGISNVIWLDRGITGDDTHGHVDDVSRFVAPGRIITCIEPDPTDPNHKLLDHNLRRLKSARLEDGARPDIIELPMPAPVIFDGQRLPASYANFLVANGIVLVPVFNDPNDRIALDILAQAIPERNIIPIYCRDFVWGLGTIHCASQQQPA
ncbi:MAG: agmatine deiminase family protein [Acidobacteriaceae bacterium]